MKSVIRLFAGFFLVTACNSEKDRTNSNSALTDIIIIMVDDMGYSDLGCFGGEIQTPHLDKLANDGLRLTRFYNNAKCYPSRASLLTGVYPHKAGLGRNILPLQKVKGKKGPYQGWLSDDVITIAEALKETKYQSYLSGKWHVGEKKEDWPLQRGFDGYFGLVSGASSYFELLGNQRRIRQMVLENDLWTPPDSGFYLTDAITDYAVQSIRRTSLDSGLFLYVAYTAPHWPLHALEEDIEKYQGVYDQGWEVQRQNRLSKMKKLGIMSEEVTLSQAPTSVPTWKTVKNQEEWIRKMQVHAAMIDRVDQGVGQIMKAVMSRGNRENTLLIFVSDNGASSENVDHRNLHTKGASVGLKGSYKSIEEPWANVSNTPFRRYKAELYEGGIRTCFIANWPAIIQSNQLNNTYTGHLMDFMPTVLDIAQVPLQENVGGTKVSKMDGKSLVPLFKGSASVNREPLCWEYKESKVVIKENWKLIQPKGEDWELYNLTVDPTELMDVVDENSDRVDRLKNIYKNWAIEIGLDASE